MSGYMNWVNDEFQKFVYSQVLPCIGVYTLYLILHGWVLGSEGTISLCNIAKRVTILCTDSSTNDCNTDNCQTYRYQKQFVGIYFFKNWRQNTQ